MGGTADRAGTLYQRTPTGWSAAQTFEQAAASEDVDAHFFDADNDGDADLYVVSGSSEFPTDDERLRDRFYRNQNGTFRYEPSALPDVRVAGSRAVAADADGDGDLDLFVGGSIDLANYPHAPRSQFLENDGTGNFTESTQEWASELQNIGMVRDASWTDLNGDERMDLVVVGEWMPVTVAYGTEDGFDLERPTIC